MKSLLQLFLLVLPHSLSFPLLPPHFRNAAFQHTRQFISSNPQTSSSSSSSFTALQSSSSSKTPILQHVNSDRISYTGTQSHSGEISVDDALLLYYTPPSPTYFRRSDSLTFFGGFNGWNGDEDDNPLVLPLRPSPLDETLYQTTLVIPNFAQSVEFCVTDGVRYDSGNDDEELFRLHVTNVQIYDEDSKQVVRCKHDVSTKAIERVGVVEEVDPTELDKLMKEEYERRKNEQVDDDDDDEQDERINNQMKDIQMVDAEIKEGALPSQTVLTVREGAEAAVRGFMAEAEVVGKMLGLGNIQIGEARTAFDNYDDETTNRVKFGDLDLVLEELGWDSLPPERIAQLVAKHVEDKDADDVGMGEFIAMYHELDSEGIGIDMI